MLPKREGARREKMARAMINLKCEKCGKEFTHIKHGCYNRSDANQYENWAKSAITTCPDCWKEEQEIKKLAEREKETVKSAEIAQSCPWQLPALQGSEKQIKWAADIRNNLIAQMIDKEIKWGNIEAAGKGENPAEVNQETLSAAKELYDAIFSISAKWWIENRGKRFFNCIFEIGRGMK